MSTAPTAIAVATPTADAHAHAQSDRRDPSALASALTKISGEMNAVPERDLRAAKPMNAFFIAPAVRGLTLGTLTATHPPLQQRLDQLARIAASLGQTR